MRLVLLVSFCSLLVPACRVPQVHDTADPAGPLSEGPAPRAFVPQRGRVPAAPEDSPGGRQLRLARSVDGLSFERLDQVVLEQSNSPALLRLPDRWLLTSTAYRPAGERDDTVVSWWVDGEAGWEHWLPSIAELPPGVAGVVEGWPVALPEGGVRLYFGADFAGAWGIHCARSADGLRYVYEGEVLTPTGLIGHDGGHVDPLVAWVGGRWHLWVTDSGTAEMVHLLSEDGLWFTEDARVALLDGDLPRLLASWVAWPEGLRAYSSDPGGRIGSFWSADGRDLVAEEGARLAPADDSHDGAWVRDPAVARDGAEHLLVYVTELEPR